MKNTTINLTGARAVSSNHNIQQNNINVAGRSSPVRNIILLLIYLGALVYILDYFA